MVAQEGESSHEGSNNSQVALDEALARSLQELGDDFEDFYPHEHNGAEAGKPYSWPSIYILLKFVVLWTTFYLIHN